MSRRRRRGGLSAVGAALARNLGRAVVDYQMLADGDRVLCAVSGGKDSYAMHDLLLRLQSRAPVRFELIAVNVDQGQPGYRGDVLAGYMARQGHRFQVVREDTYSIVRAKVPEDKTPCALCSRLRRAVLYRAARALGCNKVALGHHRDDVVVTLMLNLVFAGQLGAMPPKLLCDAGDLVVIRPLVLCAEQDIAHFASERAYPIVPCALCHDRSGSQRRAIGQMLAELEVRHPAVRSNIMAALRNVRPSQLLDVGLWRALNLPVVAAQSQRAAVERSSATAASEREG